jgi:uncharacterized protein (DUF1015 family)
MALVYPFRGLRYNKEVVGNYSEVVTQPYDKTTPSMQDAYYQRSPYNVVRITLNSEKKSDADTQYPEAGLSFNQWIEQRVLIQDNQPVIYAYYQEYTIEGQTRLQRGFIALLDLKNSGSGIIPHEHTLAAPKRDRLHLMRSTEGNEDLIYMLYADDSLAIDHIMDASISGRLPEIEVEDEYGAIHRIWAITDPDVLSQIQNSMQSQKLFIADGHHRFETSINFMHECVQKNWFPAGVESFDKRMVTCFNSVGSITILATHRLVRDLSGFDMPSFLQTIEPLFSAESMPSADGLWREMNDKQKNHVFGFYAGSDEFYLLRMKPSAREDPLLLKHAEAYRELDVSILHSLLLERYLGIDEGKLAAQSNIDYERERESCIRLIDEGKYQAAFFLNPTSAEQMQRIASSGERMPQKSTDFYPKLLTGLIFMKMKIEKRQNPESRIQNSE